jgi:tubulin epsilon
LTVVGECIADNPHARQKLQGFKVGLCSKPPVGASQSILSLSNNCCISEVFGTMRRRFNKLFGRQMYVHHYTEFMEREGMAEARQNVATLQSLYDDMSTLEPSELENVYVPRGDSFV